MSLAQIQQELRKLSSQEKLALADYLVRDAEADAAPSPEQVTELERRLAEAAERPESLLSPEEALRRVRR